MNNIHSHATSGELDQSLADHIAGLILKSIDNKGEASLAVSGGSTPKGLFRLLSGWDLPWNKVSITLVDERMVPSDSDDSNERLVKENLLQNRAAVANWVSLHGESDNPEQSLMESRTRIAAIKKPFTVVVLGMGGDGHTASWFPRATNLQQLLDPKATEQVATTDPVTAPHKRITLTLPAVLNADEIIVHIVGQEKLEVLKAAREQQYPIAAVIQQNQTPCKVWWSPNDAS